MLDLIKAVIMGIIEGITEWLPVSSTGHMILADEFIQLGLSDAFFEVFLVVIQLGAIFAVITLYWKRLFPLSFAEKPVIKKESITLWLKIVIACLPAAVIGIPFDDKINELFFNYKTVAAALIFYGVLFIVTERTRKAGQPRIETLEKLDFKTAFFIGFFQALSVIPGTSRSGATIIGAMLLGTSRTAAAEFSFFLAIPIMLGASLLKLIKFGGAFTGHELSVLIAGAVSAYVVSMAAIKFLTGYVKKHDFSAFGWYRIILGIAVILYFWLF